jgi:hypothetical protein
MELIFIFLLLAVIHAHLEYHAERRHREVMQLLSKRTAIQAAQERMSRITRATVEAMLDEVR